MTAIKRTRIKFFIVMAVIIFTIILAFCLSILVSTNVRNKNSINQSLEKMIAEFDNPTATRPTLPGVNGFNEMRGFAVLINSDFEAYVVKRNDACYSVDVVLEYLEKIKNTGKTAGKVDDLQFLIKDVQDWKIAACLDVSMESSMFNGLLKTVLFAGGGGMAVLLILVWFLSFWIIKPTANALNKQKRFISEAGHELRTPLSVISASVELLQKEEDPHSGQKWLHTIKDQTDKMSAMTAELLTLSKLDEGEILIKTEFDLSQTILTDTLAFESVAFENGKKFLCDIETGLMCKGDQKAVRTAVGILCDNAVKYAVEGSEITVKLKKQSTKTVFSVSNTADSIDKKEIPMFFERFYRGSDSRASVGGAGLGLAILKMLADKNKWAVDVQTDQDNITFSIVF